MIYPLMVKILVEIMIIYLNFGERVEDMIDHRSNIQNLSSWDNLYYLQLIAVSSQENTNLPSLSFSFFLDHLI